MAVIEILQYRQTYRQTSCFFILRIYQYFSKSLIIFFFKKNKTPINPSFIIKKPTELGYLKKKTGFSNPATSVNVCPTVLELRFYGCCHPCFHFKRLQNIARIRNPQSENRQKSKNPQSTDYSAIFWAEFCKNPNPNQNWADC